MIEQQSNKSSYSIVSRTNRRQHHVEQALFPVVSIDTLTYVDCLVASIRVLSFVRDVFSIGYVVE
jgi:hypothetical protein